MPPFTMAVLSAEVILGSLTFTGSLMAAGKLQEILPAAADHLQRARTSSISRLLGISVLVAVFLVFHPEQTELFPLIAVIPMLFGVLMIIPIGGADMPTVISLLEFVRRPFRGGDGLCARQQALDRRRGARWGFGLYPFCEHVEGDESVVHERSLRGVRAGASRRPRRRARRRRSRARRAEEAAVILVGGQQGGHRAGLRHGGRAGPAQGARAV